MQTVELGEIESDDVLARAVVRSLEVIGEAASKIPEAYRTKHPAIPWRKIVGLRNRLIHGYFAIDFDILTGILRQDISGLRSAVENALGEPEVESE